MDVNQKEIRAMVMISQETKEDTINSVRLKLQETIKTWVKYVLSCVD
jgi:hypothetical protein